MAQPQWQGRAAGRDHHRPPAHRERPLSTARGGFRVGVGPLTTQLGQEGDTRTASEVWRDAIRMATRAEELGFDSVWVGEHHFTDDGYLPAVFPLLGAIAAVTTRVTLGTKVLLAPLHHPVRLAEDAAAVQALSDGRLVLGAAIGYRDEEFDGFGVAKRDRVARLEDAVRVGRAAWAGAGDHGTVFRPHVGEIPVWLGGAAQAALVRAGTIGDGFVAPVGPASDVGRQLAVVEAAAAEAGRPAPGLASSSFMLVEHPDLDRAAQERCLDGLLDGYVSYKADDPLSRVGRRSESRTMVLEGTPAQLAAMLREYRDLLPPDRLHHHVVRLEYPGMTIDQVDRTMQVVAHEVLPRLERP